MHIKLIALIVVATAVIAAPAPEGVQADVIDNHAGPPETTGTRVSTVARDDHVQSPPESCDPHRRCTTGDAQCCQLPRQESTRAIPVEVFSGEEPINIDNIRFPGPLQFRNRPAVSFHR